MDNVNAGATTLLTAIEDEIAASKRQGSDFSVVTFKTHEQLDLAERRKLVDWASLLLGTCLPEAEQAALLDPDYACFALIRQRHRPQARCLAGHFIEQLNRLPVRGVAPGNGWQADVCSYNHKPAAVEGVMRRLRLSETLRAHGAG